MEPIISYKSDPLAHLHSKTYIKVLPWDQLGLVVGRRYRVKLNGEIIHKAVLKHAQKFRILDLPETYLILAYNKKRSAALKDMKSIWKWLGRDMYVGVYLFEQEGFPGNAGEQPGGATDSSSHNLGFISSSSSHVGNGVEGPSILEYAGNPLPDHLRTAKDKESIKELAMYVASAYQHILIVEDGTDMRKIAQNNQIIMHAVSSINPYVDANHGFAIVSAVNSIRGDLMRKKEVVAAKQGQLFS